MSRFRPLLILAIALSGVRSASAQAPPSPPPDPSVTSPTSGPSDEGYAGTWLKPEKNLAGQSLAISGAATGSSYGVEWTWTVGTDTGSSNYANCNPGNPPPGTFNMPGYTIPTPPAGSTRILVILTIRSLDSQGRASGWVQYNFWAYPATQ